MARRCGPALRGELELERARAAAAEVGALALKREIETADRLKAQLQRELREQEEAWRHLAMLPGEVPVGTTVDWRGPGPPWPGPGGKTGPVWWQGNCGSCWAFAATANIESYAAINNVTLTKLSAQEVSAAD